MYLSCYKAPRHWYLFLIILLLPEPLWPHQRSQSLLQPRSPLSLLHNRSIKTKNVLKIVSWKFYYSSIFTRINKMLCNLCTYTSQNLKPLTHICCKFAATISSKVAPNAFFRMQISFLTHSVSQTSGNFQRNVLAYFKHSEVS